MNSLVVTAWSLNMRSAPSVEANVLKVLNRGDMVKAIGGSANGYWQQIEHAGDQGWASFKYLQPYVEDLMVSPFPWFDIALKELHTSEVAGAGSNPRILEYLRSTTLRGSAYAETDRTAWCSAFVNFCVEQVGYAGTDNSMARSWQHWGKPTTAPSIGSITVLKRGDPPSGHVGFFISRQSGMIKLLGGNQGNRVCFGDFDEGLLLSHRNPA